MNLKTVYCIGILLGSSLEMYNYMLFPFIQSIIMPFFYQGRENIGFFILFLAALFRPLGSLFFGYIGDRYGRKFSLLLSMILMSFSCFLILFLPKYSTIGNYAVIGLIFARILQVLSVSGEHAGVAISLIESWKGDSSLKFNRYGLASGLVYLFSMLGTFLVTCVVCRVNAYNWQKAYFLSFFLVVFCFLLRFLPYSEQVTSNEEDNSNNDFFRNFVACLLISAAMSGLYYFSTVFIGIYFEKHGVLNFGTFNEINLFVYMFSTCFWGWISDFFESLYFFILIPCVVLYFGLIFALYFCNPYLHIFNIFVLAMYAGPSHAYFFKLFSRKYRYRGVSVAYSLGTAIIGSSTPLIAASLASNVMLICLYLAFLFSLSIVGVLLSYKTLRNSL